MNKTVYIVITLALLIGIGRVFFGGSNETTQTAVAAENVEIIDGVQYVTVDAKAGYSPRLSMAKAGIPTQLIVKTDSTYDCSASLVIRSVGFQKILAPTGKEVIDLGTPKTGQSVQGLCSMGMYSFSIKFS